MAEQRVVKVTRWFKLQYETPASAYGLTDDEIRGLESFPFTEDDFREWVDSIKEIQHDVAIVTVIGK